MRRSTPLLVAVLGVGFVAGFIAATTLFFGFMGYAREVLHRRAAARQGVPQPSVPRVLPEPQLRAPSSSLFFDYQLPLESPEGGRFKLLGLQGKVLVVNIWASWCEPCLAEMPELEALASQFRGDDAVSFLLISKDPKTNLRFFLREHGAPGIPVASLPQGVEVPGAEGPVPQTLIVRQDGSVVVLEVGAARWSSKRVAAFVRDLAKRPASSMGHVR